MNTTAMPVRIIPRNTYSGLRKFVLHQQWSGGMCNTVLNVLSGSNDTAWENWLRSRWNNVSKSAYKVNELWILIDELKNDSHGMQNHVQARRIARAERQLKALAKTLDEISAWTLNDCERVCGKRRRELPPHLYRYFIDRKLERQQNS